MLQQQAAVGGGAGVAYESAYSVRNSVVTTRSPSFTLGSAPPENTILVAFINHASGFIGVADPSGWTNALGANVSVQSDSNSFSCYTHRVTAGEAGSSTVTWTLTNLFDVDGDGNIVVAGFSGVDTTTAVDVASSGFSSSNTATPHDIPALTAGVDDGYLVGCIGVNGSSTHTTATGWSNLDVGATNSQTTSVFRRDALTTVSESVAATSFTPSVGDEYCAVALVLRPA